MGNEAGKLNREVGNLRRLRRRGCQVGYVFAATRGKARSVALATDPGSGSLPYSDNDFLTYNVVRCSNLDGKAVNGSAWWYPGDILPESGVNPGDLWYDLEEDEN